MIAVDEAALRCDMMETYRIPDYRELPARQAALFACGLRPNSRIMLKLSGAPADMQTLLLAGILDNLKILVWQNTPDGHEGIHQPASVLQAILREDEPREVVGFDTAEEFNAWRASMTGA